MIRTIEDRIKEHLPNRYADTLACYKSNCYLVRIIDTVVEIADIDIIDEFWVDL